MAAAKVHKPPCVGNVSTSDASLGLADMYVTRIDFLSAYQLGSQRQQSSAAAFHPNACQCHANFHLYLP